ncbi:MAG: RES family NAD+ phosphorylase [Rhodospirillales bacterium]|nr:RES family NAD+ phosphorylase [Rhodospirillales bacterium]
MEPAAPTPPPDLAERSLPLHPAPAGMTLFRIVAAETQPLFFGPKPGDLPAGRFDAADGSFRTCYAGLTPEACFAEKFLRRLRDRAIEAALVRTMVLVRLELLRPLTLVALHGPGLAQIAATAAVAHGPYATSRPWAATLFAHPQCPDGLCWRSRFDDSLFCVALFDRCKGDLQVGEKVALISQQALLLAMINRWRLALIE